MDQLEITSHAFRKARTRSLIQLAGLCEKAGLLDTFEISLGLDLQRDPDLKLQVAALFSGLVELNKMAQSEDVNLQLWAYKGLELLADEKRKK